MTALEVLKMAFDCGIDIQVQGDNLHLNAKQAPSNQLLAELNRLLDEEDTSLTLTTLTSAANALGKQIKIELQELHH